MKDVSAYLVIILLVCMQLASVKVAIAATQNEKDYWLNAIAGGDNSYYYCENDCLTAPKPKAQIHLGLLNARAINQPTPKYSAEFKKKQISGTIIVDIVVDSSSGAITWANIKSGPKLLRDEVIKMVCEVKFPPANDLGNHIMVSGTLMWKFKRCAISSRPLVYCLGY